MSKNGGEVYRITGARSSLSEDVRGRQRRYVVSMLLRTVCVLLAVVLWDVQRWLAFGALAGAVLLPYFAVLVANAGRERAPGLPSTFDIPADTPLMLGPGGTGGAGGTPATAGTGGAQGATTDSSQDVS
ncbi:DUF3099 domain-containing protein [Streptomyces rubellomurinus]|uniref:Integral membrane protein n=2 Tax=Streptomyces TaxID=1883 RepID=A0A0F2TF45_STRR3|nr:DUF3099 domain-containing protein [Streptomyces rubellomurinus]KJS56676.1 hypothetical protein VM98_05520 [Streptomyces rubellomurinus subsp. indigoferus]KJS60357.1 hypothetical protein VM95_21720 [Streptomyces rubellomurinus]